MAAVERERVRTIIRDYFSNRGEVIFAYLHGSFIEGERFRDIDIAVYLDKPEGIEYELDQSILLERILKMPVDVKILNSAPLAFRYHATKGLLILSRDDELREEFIERAWDEYLDFKPVALTHLREVMLG
jgi:predicted nucleotidyltransferase